MTALRPFAIAAAVSLLLAVTAAASSSADDVVLPIAFDAGNYIGNLTLTADAEPVDVIYSFAQQYRLDDKQRVELQNKICSFPNVQCQRQHPVIFSSNVEIATTTTTNNNNNDHDDQVTHSEKLAILEGQEPVDAVDSFCQSHGVNATYCESLLETVCKELACQRMQPIVYQSQPIATAEGKVLGSFAIVRHQEPVDAVDYFCQIHGLDSSYRDSILEVICEELECTRMIPVVYSKTINDESGNMLGSLNVLEGEEVADAAHRFLRSFPIPLDRVGLKNHLFQHACPLPRVKCTRLVANVYDENVLLSNGTVLGRLIIREGQEPADTVWGWTNENDIIGFTGGSVEEREENEGFVISLIENVCREEGVVCNRRAPVIKRIPLSGPDGVHVGVFELMLRQEPIDALYGFFSRHGLFEKGWDIKVVLAQLCNLDGILCNRNNAVKYRSDNFTMGGRALGPLMIDEDEEVVDVLYRLRLKHNFTIEEQMQSFAAICNEPTIYCSRSRAAIYSKYGISVLDYARFGNETCQRKYAGIQFLSSFADSFIGGSIVSLLKRDEVLSIIEHALLGPTLTITLLLFVWSTLRIIDRTKKLPSPLHAVVYLYSLILLCTFYTSFIEPIDGIDVAVHLQEGRLPDLHIFEGEEPADAVLAWGKAASKEHHPIVRQPIHYEILDSICEAKNVTCRRRRAWELIDMGAITLHGNAHKIQYYNPMVDPTNDSLCSQEFGHAEDDSTCLLRIEASRICQRIHPQPTGCVNDITTHMSRQLQEYNTGRLDSKNTYRKLELEMDALDRELFPAMSRIVLSRNVNLAPLARLDNGTATYYSWDAPMSEAWAAVDAFGKVKVPESREWNDKPCTPLFGGSLCAKHDKDGNLMIEV